jgi:alkane 1-monooxygenase
MLVVSGFYLGGWFIFLPVVFVFGILPVIDHKIGLYTNNVPAADVKHIEDDLFFRRITYWWAAAQTTFLIWAIWIVGTGKILVLQDWIGFVLGCSIVTGGIGITVAHELGHKKSNLERFLSQFLLMQVCYMHFYIEHNRGHHVHVATPEDPATARVNESFFAFWLRSVFVGYIHAWKIEIKRLQRLGLSAIHPQNSMILYALIPIGFCLVCAGSIFLLTGNYPSWQIPVFFFSQSILAFTLLELVNYIEHYGIVRKLQPNGHYEVVNPLHSWNASHKLSNYFLFQLQRHSDHHYNALKRYQVLNHYDESPQLPYGYPTMIMIALVPPLWFKMMNPLLADWKATVQEPLPS